MVVGGVEVTGEDLADGIGVTFTAAPGRAGAVQSRVRGLGASLANGDDAELSPVLAVAHPQESGAHLMLTTRDPAAVANVRTVVRARIASLTTDGCPPPATLPEPEPPPAFRKVPRTAPHGGGHVH